MAEILKVLREKLERLLETGDLSWAEAEKIRRALQKLDEFEASFSDLSDDVVEIVTEDAITPQQLMDRI